MPRPTPFPSRTVFCALALMVATVACNSDGVTNPEADIPGTYSLKTVNGSPLPYTVVDSEGSYIIVSDVMTLDKDKTWKESISYRLDQTTPIVAEPDWDRGTWTLAGGVLTFHSTAYSDEPAYTATHSGNTLTVTALGLVQVFQK
ncbi:MAG: hypothetical protein ABIW94_02110 [Gemmatimonadaceae bacterium]